MTHAELVAIAARWLRNTKGCGVVLTEHSAGREFPDAMGWKTGFSQLVECKVSRADFFADRRKPTRAHPDVRPAWHCWYLTPAHLVTQFEIPDGWGLLWWTGKRVTVIKDQPREWADIDDAKPARLRNEIYRMYCELRRYQVQGIRYLTINEQKSLEAQRARASLTDTP